MAYSATVVVRSKTGELAALRELAPEEARAVRICVDLVSDGPDLMKGLTAALEHLKRNGQKPLLDVTKVHSSSRLRDQPGGPLDPVVRNMTEGPNGQLALDAELPFSPVVPLRIGDRELRGYAMLREAYDCTFGLRVPVTCPVGEAPERIERHLAALRISADAVELLIDAGFLAGSATVVRDCGRLATELGTRYRFGSITVVGGSIPPKRGELAPGVLARPEFELWQQVRTGAPAVRYGDYGVVHPEAGQPDEPNKPRTRPNPYLFYTGRRRTRFAYRAMLRDDKRRPLPGEDPGAYFREVAQETVASEEYQRCATGAWGDRRLRDCSNGDAVAANSPDWIAIGTSHHIAHLAARGDLEAA
ncbi:beta family protein [Saccharopolyspora phatthalungensis]|uniref:T4 beta protein n=1 Tax=Saccharopolyspora phatthalungensis TaxID=664693 RepID=A0A840QAU9_9PSEU|nr:hypothetical protein [Saccharopolyspora phatthalungensis]MBB5155679.1 hypothetical protein [Saccharopolyspora phatthalungensis]